MKKSCLILFILSLVAVQADAQLSDDNDNTGKTQRAREFGIRAGYNIPRLAGQKNMNMKPGTNNGYTVSVSFSPAAKSGLGFRSELVYSSQNFGFTSDGKKTMIRHQYLYLPQFTTIGLGKVLQLQLGGQVGWLLNAEQTGDDEKVSLMSFMNKLEYGAAGGLEVYPFKGIIIGGRYNMNFSKTFKAPTTADALNPLPFNPSEVKRNHAMINFYIGYKF